MEEKSTGKGPEKKFKAGAISANVWLNNGQKKDTGESIAYKTISLDRAYKDKNGEWKHTASLRIADIPKATLVLNKAYEFLVMQGQDPSQQMAGEIPVEEVY